MNALTQNPTSISDALRQVAMVADISTSALGLTRTDKVASKKANTDHAAKDGAGKVVVHRFAGADDKIRRILDIQKLAADNLKSNSMAWGNSKRRLLPNANFQRWNARHAELEKEHEDAVKDLVDNADAILAAAKANLGTFDIPLPTKDECARAFTLTHTLEPLPDGSQFGNVMGADGSIMDQASEHLRWQFEQNMAAHYNSAVQDAAQRLAKPLENLVERMEAYEKRERDVANGKNPGKEGYFRDTIITNVQEIASVFGAMNVLGDSKLASIAGKLKVFGMLDADTLRNRSDVRAATAARAKDIVKELESLLV